MTAAALRGDGSSQSRACASYGGRPGCTVATRRESIAYARPACDACERADGSCMSRSINE
ncbi:hypothetical protein BSLA_02r3973 [Burkholderia stabilis]|nr:hypothetical protein BSLA_02r3973 [Burkholderia stabilis]